VPESPKGQTHTAYIISSTAYGT